ncbi:MAG: NACHT domain-containing protein [Methanosarcinales archaeon]|nr:MAG: NACHT domain-containing protein [Methanosarcinales archaeon]
MLSISWRSILRAIAVISWIASIAWFYFEPGWEPLIAVLTGTAAFIVSFFVSDVHISILTSEKTKSAREERKRQGMLKLVRGVLEQSLPDEVLIELGLEERRDAVLNGQGMELQRPGHPNRQLPPGTKVIDVFDEMGQTLLILGEPGSGKTTLLIELARDTIDRAEEDPNRRIPVVFNLSSWTDAKQSIADWLVDELKTKYYIPKKIAGDWIENDDLLLLLDGLDEVFERRESCVCAINDFRHEHGLTPLVVCCRSEEYETLETRLDLKGAISLQPLTEEQVDEYLDRMGQELAGLRSALTDDPVLYELARTPLMLSIMTLAYQGMSVHDLQPLETVDARRKHIFDNYVERMFKPRTQRTLPDYPETDSIPDRKNNDECFSKEETLHWLSWLAKRMLQYGQSVFLIERMQSDWLTTRVQWWIMAGGVAVTAGALVGLLIGLFVVAVGTLSGQFTLIWLFVGLFAGAIFGVIFGILFGLLDVLFSYDGVIRPVETLRFSWPAMITKAVVLGLLVLLACRLSIINFDLRAMLTLVLPLVLIVAVFAGLIKGEIVTSVAPNEGMRRSAHNAVYAWLLLGLLIGSFLWIFLALNVRVEGLWLLLAMLPVMLLIGLLLGLVFGFPIWLNYGGRACIQHYILRIMLWRNGSAPLNYVRFLDYAAEHVLLRKVGGGYIFMHRLLLEYFASLEPEERGD